VRANGGRSTAVFPKDSRDAHRTAPLARSGHTIGRSHHFEICDVVDLLKPMIRHQCQGIVLGQGLEDVADQLVGAFHHRFGVRDKRPFLMLLGIQLGEMQQHEIRCFPRQEIDSGQRP